MTRIGLAASGGLSLAALMLLGAAPAAATVLTLDAKGNYVLSTPMANDEAAATQEDDDIVEAVPVDAATDAPDPAAAAPTPFAAPAPPPPRSLMESVSGEPSADLDPNSPEAALAAAARLAARLDEAAGGAEAETTAGVADTAPEPVAETPDTPEGAPQPDPGALPDDVWSGPSLIVGETEVASTLFPLQPVAPREAAKPATPEPTPFDGLTDLPDPGALAPAAQSEILAIVLKEVAKHDVLDAAFVTSVIEAESNYDPVAVSPKGAMGLMQIMPATAERLGVVNPFSPEQNIRAGTQELARLMERYRNPALALAAYNAGEGAVETYDGVPPFAETQGYIVKVLTRTFAKRDAARGGDAEPEPEATAEARAVERRFEPMRIQEYATGGVARAMPAAPSSVVVGETVTASPPSRP